MLLFILLHVYFGLLEASKPNIVVIIADDLGWNDVGFHGSNQIRTPNMDALAYNGIVFNKHYTLPSCTPSRSAFLTGQYPIRLGYQGFPMRGGENRTVPRVKTLPKALKELGYSTHLVGKWHLGSGYKNATPTSYGYDEHYGYWNGYIGYFDHSITEYTLDGLVPKIFKGIDFHHNLEPVINETGNYFTDLITKKAINVIENQPEGEPLYLAVMHLAPHSGKTVGPGLTIMETANPAHNFIKYRHISDPVRRKFAETVERLDDSVGKVVAALEKKGILKDTIIVFFSDNGAPTTGIHANHGSNFPLRGIKMTNFEGAIRVPAAVYYSKFKERGMIFNELFHITDWVPTLYNAAGGDVSYFDKIDGIDQWENLLNQKDMPLRKELLVNIDEKDNNSSGYIKGDYKLVYNSIAPFDGFIGDAGRNRSYNTTEVINSYVSKAIRGNFSATQVKEESKRIKELRSKLTLKDCSKFFPHPQKCSGKCLFNIKEDPCEANDISSRNKNIVDELWKKIKDYEKHLVPQQNTDVSLKSDPSKCHGTWFPYLEENGCYYNRSQSI